jgi:hypothetical protein
MVSDPMACGMIKSVPQTVLFHHKNTVQDDEIALFCADWSRWHHCCFTQHISHAP